MTHKINIKALVIFILFCVFGIYSCTHRSDNEGRPLALTYQDTLPYLIANSDLIALVTISGGLESRENLSWFSSPPKKVRGEINTIIYGEEKRSAIEIFSEPKHFNSGVTMSIILLKNGGHLTFLSSSGEQYQPTTRSSLLHIFHGKLYPTWRKDHYSETRPDGKKISSGVPLEKVLKEIENELKKANKTLNDDSPDAG
ncbi:MAG: hypothetical protein ACI8ZB_003767 [Desulforhopalus sp.]|jgi:hypothetical protein